MPYSQLQNYLKEKHPAFYDFIEETRNGIDGYGPCEARTINAIGEDAVQQLYACLREYMLIRADWMEEEFKREKEWLSKAPEDQEKQNEKAAAAFKKPTLAGSGVLNEQHRYRRFCETVTQQIRHTAMEVYPEIEELEPEQLKDFKYFFVDEIIRMAENIQKLLAGKK